MALPVTNLLGKSLGKVDFHPSFVRNVAEVNEREGVSVKLWPIFDATKKTIIGFTCNFEQATNGFRGK